MNLNIFENTFAGFKPTSLGSLNKNQRDNNCSGNCQARLNGAFWLANQRYWVYKCFCCGARQIKPDQKLQTSFNWGGIYE